MGIDLENELVGLQRNFSEKLLNVFDIDFSHARDKIFFLDAHRDKLMLHRYNLGVKTKIGVLLQTINHELALDDRKTFMKMVISFNKEKKRNIHNTLKSIAEINAIDLFVRILHDKIYSLRHANSPVPNSSVSVKKRPALQKTSNLADIFSDREQYDVIISQLIEYGFCTDSPLSWTIGENGAKQMLCCFLFVLRHKGYYQGDIIPTIKTLIAIAKNTFKVSISRSTFNADTMIYSSKFFFVKNVGLNR